MTRTITHTFEVETVEFQGVELIGVRGIKQLTGYGSAAISNLLSRKSRNFPKPVIDMGQGIRLWRFDEIEKWWRNK